jgi:hypothetical protein
MISLPRRYASYAAGSFVGASASCARAPPASATFIAPTTRPATSACIVKTSRIVASSVCVHRLTGAEPGVTSTSSGATRRRSLPLARSERTVPVSR